MLRTSIGWFFSFVTSMQIRRLNTQSHGKNN
jgi:hypothetical protein